MKWEGVEVVIIYCVGVFDIGEAVVVIVVFFLYRKVVYEVNEYVIEWIK